MLIGEDTSQNGGNRIGISEIDFGKKSTSKTEVMRSVWQLEKREGGANVVQTLNSY
jgi:hypothetical protein